MVGGILIILAKLIIVQAMVFLDQPAIRWCIDHIHLLLLQESEAQTRQPASEAESERDGCGRRYLLRGCDCFAAAGSPVGWYNISMVRLESRRMFGGIWHPVRLLLGRAMVSW